MDLDETLIHYECDDDDGDYYLIRPGAIKFLKEMLVQKMKQDFEKVAMKEK